MNPPINRALVVEDDLSWQQILKEILSDCGLEVDVAGNLNDAVIVLKDHPHRLAVVDLSLSLNDHNNLDGLRVLDAVRKLDPNCRALLLTGFATVELAVTALTDYDAFTFLRKESFNRGQFRDLIYRMLASAPQQNNSIDLSKSQVDNNIKPISLPISSNGKDIKEKAIIVEDDAGWRNIIEELLSDLNIQVRSCSSFGEAMSYLRREKFSLAIVDLSLNGSITDLWDQKSLRDNLGGYQLLATTKSNNVPTIVVSGVASTEDIKSAYSEHSIFAYMEKQAFDRTIFRRIIEEARKTRLEGNELSVLTDRESDVLNHLAQGLTNKEIAEKLVITTNTVKRHLKAIFEKLDVHTRSAAAAKALAEK